MGGLGDSVARATQREIDDTAPMFQWDLDTFRP